MSVASPAIGSAHPDPFGGMSYFRKISVPEYHEMIRTGILGADDAVELLEGHLVLKMPRGPAHDFAIQALNKRLLRLLPDGYELRNQSAATLPDSEPEPDFAVVRGDERVYHARYPEPADVVLLIEVSNSSVARDTVDKARIYARAGVPEYWVVNIPDRRVEVYADPDAAANPPAYRTRREHLPGDAVPLVLDGNAVGSVAVAEVLG